MSFTPFLEAVAEALMTRVHPAVTDERSRDALEACVRALAGMAGALETLSEAEIAGLPLPDGLDAPGGPLLVDDPPENLAANDHSAARIAVAANWLAGGEWLRDQQAGAMGRVMLQWERLIGQRKIAAMNRLERGAPDADDDRAKLVIDRAALERYFVARCPAGSGARIAAFRQTIGGRSRQTAVFTLEGDTGLPRGMVVQRDHPANISSFGVALQYPVLELVSASELKTSRPLLLETDASVLGAPFMVLEQARGGGGWSRLLRSAAVAGAGVRAGGATGCFCTVSIRRHWWAKIASTVAPGDAGGWAADLARLEATWQRFAHAPSLTIAAALAWMRTHVGGIGGELAIVHNDAAFHNILVEEGRFSSLLDWELVHLGHPAEDLGYCRAFVQEIADWGVFMDAYVAAGGRRFNAALIDFFSLRAGVHLMTLLQYGRSMFISGVTSDINLAEAATAFMPKHHARIAAMLHAITDRNN